MFAAVRLVRLAPETVPNDPLHVPEVIVPTVARLLSVVMELMDDVAARSVMKRGSKRLLKEVV